MASTRGLQFGSRPRERVALVSKGLASRYVHLIIPMNALCPVSADSQHPDTQVCTNDLSLRPTRARPESEDPRDHHSRDPHPCYWTSTSSSAPAVVPISALSPRTTNVRGCRTLFIKAPIAPKEVGLFCGSFPEGRGVRLCWEKLKPKGPNGKRKNNHETSSKTPRYRGTSLIRNLKKQRPPRTLQ